MSTGGNDLFAGIRAPNGGTSPHGPLTVREVTVHIKQLLEQSELLRELEVVGEISNFTRHRSGHLYFSLKDEYSTLSCVCFRNAALRLEFEPEDGQRVVAAGEITVYEKGGRYQLLVRAMRPDGLGPLAVALEKLKAKLAAEGLFDPSRKRPLPRFPSRIGIITSPSGAALQDLITVISRRYPLAHLFIFPTLVQGEAAPASIVSSLHQANAFPGLDVLIVGRGGGSLEDLWAFNDETVARAIFGSRVPVISAVGHETDVTIADLVADCRAPTPSAAGEIAVPDSQELTLFLTTVGPRLARALQQRARSAKSQLRSLLTRPSLRRPRQQIAEYLLRTDEATKRMSDSLHHEWQRCQLRLETLGGKLDALGPPAVLARGYSITRRMVDGAIVREWAQVKSGEDVEILLHKGLIRARTDKTIPPASAAEGQV
ncbi:MAG: exodeoxyribonuclease VII large subunit [Candidatus Zipacnadales bacterium]